MVWIDINDKQPQWYKDVVLMVGGNVMEHWHRLSGDNDEVYYGSLQTDEIIPEEEVSHWGKI
jgi:hypothetical protein